MRFLDNTEYKINDNTGNIINENSFITRPNRYDETVWEGKCEEEYVATPISVVLHPKNEHPIHGLSLTQITVSEEGTSKIVILEQPADSFGDSNTNSIRLTLKELEAALREAKKLLSHH